jgi:hypothetical protein
MSSSIPSRIPRPARRIATSTTFFPSSIGASIFASGVSIATSVSFMSRVAS